MAIDLGPLWDFNRPELSEQRFRAALATVEGDDALILKTQIARSWGLRQDFARARELLREIEAAALAAGPEVQVRWWLEWGRTHASAAHPKPSSPASAQFLADQATARRAWQHALGLARQARLDGLAVDAIHMFAFVDTAPADQLRWATEALAVVEGSDQPAARRWEPSIRNNLGYALHQLGRHADALVQFERAVALRQRMDNPEALRVAWWMVAWTQRSLGRYAEALAIQQKLERESQAAGQPDPHVFSELEALYRAMGDEARARHYAERLKPQASSP